MAREDRLGLVKRSLQLLVDELRPTDEVGIVTYGSRGSVLLQLTDGGDKRALLGAIDGLQPGGSTFVEEGLELAYRMAARRVRDGRITRVLLLSDGVGNVGNTEADSILREIKAQVNEGVTLTTIGFGMGNFNDILMEQLANDGTTPTTTSTPWRRPAASSSRTSSALSRTSPWTRSRSTCPSASGRWRSTCCPRASRA